MEEDDWFPLIRPFGAPSPTRGEGKIIIHMNNITHQLITMLDKNIISSAFDKNIEVIILKSTTSTNDYLKTQPQSNTTKICLAEQQTQGKGRLGKNWHSPFGKNIYLSCRTIIQKNLNQLHGLSQILALACKTTLAHYRLPQQPMVKWPNDVFYQGKKIAGDLIEIVQQTATTTELIIGIGININMLPEDDLSISQPWVSLTQILNQTIDRNQFAIILLKNLFHYLQRFENEDFIAFISEWLAVDCLFDQIITVSQADKITVGRAKGIDHQGRLLLELPDGNLQAFNAAEASVVRQI